MGHSALEHEAMAALIIAPSFEAVRDVYLLAHERLGEDAGIATVEFRINSARHDTDRHFAACSTTGKRIEMAPEGADLPLETLTAILCHEFGHASDFLHPGRWEMVGRDRPAVWLAANVSDEKKTATMRRWLNRTDDEIEFWADAIAYSVTGKRVGYCGPCLVQCFDGVPRPRGLR
jgi:hypothetical protein